MKKKKQKKNRLNANEFHEIITQVRKTIEKTLGSITWHGTKDEFGEHIALLIDKGLITHNKGSDSYHYGMSLACIFNVRRANGKRENLKHTAIYEGIKRGKSNLNSEK